MSKGWEKLVWGLDKNDNSVWSSDSSKVYGISYHGKVKKAGGLCRSHRVVSIKMVDWSLNFDHCIWH
jgi:hypothetical protein